MDKDFLHKIDLDTLQKEMNKSLDEIGALVKMKNPKGVYKWSKSQDDYGTRPSYNAIVRLLQGGASVETLFGVEYKRNVKKESEGQIQLTPNDLSWAFSEAMKLLQDQKDKEQK